MEKVDQKGTSSSKPIEIPEEQTRFLFRFADKVSQVNWQAQYKPNAELITDITPQIHDFLDRGIRTVTFDPTSLRAVIGISGGLDSATTIWLAAQVMEQARQQNRARETSLVMLAFRGMSDEDLEYARRFAEEVGRTFPNLPIDYVERDLTPFLRKIDMETDEWLKETRKPKYYSGELATRLIDCVTLEFANKSAHCALDSTNFTEVALGEINIGAGCELEPIIDLYKSQVYDLAQYIGVPDFILNRHPINSTFGHDKIRGYFGEIPKGLSPREIYGVLDLALFMIYELKYNPKIVTEQLGHSLEFIQHIYNRVSRQNHRRSVPAFVVPDRKGRALI